MLPDLPVELWVHIMSMLSRDHIHKLVGISRTVFSLVMDEIYEEVRFVSDDQVTRKIFYQLERPSIAQRVQRVYIRPDFFPRMGNSTEVKKPLMERLKARAVRFGRKVPPLPAPEPAEEVLLVARRGIANCTAVEDLTIVFHDLLPPSTFKTFLHTTWASIAPTLRRLTLDATLPKLAFLLNPAILPAFPHLTELHISIEFSRLSPRHERDPRVIVPFVNSLSGTLSCLKISSSEVVDLADLFYGLTHFPHLRKLGVYVAFNNIGFKVPLFLDQFVKHHQKTLQDLTLRPLDALISPNALHYRAWVMGLICELEFPILQSIDIGLLMEYPFTGFIIPSLYSTRLPYLTSLVLVDAYLSMSHVEALFGDTFNGNRLETLQVRVEELNPRILYILAEKLPHLTSLDLTFERRSVETLSARDTYNAYDSDFEQQMMGCELPNWKLCNLKLSRVCWWLCYLPHYELRTMEIVARSLPLPVTLGTWDYCVCAVKRHQHDYQVFANLD